VTIGILDEGVPGSEERVVGLTAPEIAGRGQLRELVVDGFSGWDAEADDCGAGLQCLAGPDAGHLAVVEVEVRATIEPITPAGMPSSARAPRGISSTPTPQP
jgi:hypothetical protein